MAKRKPLPLGSDNWRSRWLMFWRDSAVLHRIAVMEWGEDYPEQMINGGGTTLCGKSGRLHMPGIFSRMGRKRCAKCCRLMGIPEGEGNPYNEGIYEAGDTPPPRPELKRAEWPESPESAGG